MLDFTKIKYNPLVVPEEDYIWEHYPDLQRRVTFCNLPLDEKYSDLDLEGLDELLKFVIIFVDPLSPLASEKDFRIRSEIALEQLGLTKKAKFFKHFEQGTTWMQDVLMTYFAMIHDLLYEQWFSQKMSIHISNTQLIDARMDSLDRSRLQKDLGERIKTLKEIEHQLFPDEYTKKLIVEASTAKFQYGFAEKYALPSET